MLLSGHDSRANFAFARQLRYDQLAHYFGISSVQNLLTIFVTVLLAELGDKTQLATLLFASDQKTSPLLVFVAAAGALVATTAIAVVLGSMAERYLALIPLKLLAGLGFVGIGLWTIADHFRGGA